MLKLLRSLLSGRSQPSTTSTQTEPDQSLSDTEILKEHFSPSKEARQALKRFTQLISRHLGSEESKRLTNRVMACLQPGDTVEEALVNGLVDERGQQHGKWMLLSVDWRASDEVEWQANELLQAFDITVPWHFGEAKGRTVPEAMLAFSSWVGQYGLSLLHLGGDTYAAFLVRHADLPAAIELASQAGLSVQDEADYARDNLS